MKRILYSIVFISLLLMGCESQYSVQEAAFIKAAKDGNILAVQTALAEGTDANGKAIVCHGLALIIASGEGHMEIVKILLEKGTDVNVRATEGVRVLSLPSGYSHTGIVRFEVEEYAKVVKSQKSGLTRYMIETENLGVTALIMASQNGHIETVKLLLEKGANVNTVTRWSGETALWIASQNGHTDIVKLLLENGADVDVKANDKLLLINFVRYGRGNEDYGITPLWIASQNGHIDVVKLLLAANADVNAANTANNASPLIIASAKGHTDVVKLLLEARAEINIKSSLTGQDETPLSIAKRMGHTQIIMLLEKAGAKE